MSTTIYKVTQTKDDKGLIKSDKLCLKRRKDVLQIKVRITFFAKLQKDFVTFLKVESKISEFNKIVT